MEICKINKHTILKIGIYHIFIKIVQILIKFYALKVVGHGSEIQT